MALIVFFATPFYGRAATPIDGEWVFDADASIPLMQARNADAPAEKLRQHMAGMRVTIDTVGKKFKVTDGDKVKVDTEILSVTEVEGVITLNRKAKSSEQYRMLSDGKLQGLEDGVPVFVLTRAQ